jgi:hypothetical protein
MWTTSFLPAAGEGPDKTRLYFNSSLTDVWGNSWPKGISQWAYNGSFILFAGNVEYSDRVFLSNVTAVRLLWCSALQTEHTPARQACAWWLHSQQWCHV